MSLTEHRTISIPLHLLLAVVSELGKNEWLLPSDRPMLAAFKVLQASLDADHRSERLNELAAALDVEPSPNTDTLAACIEAAQSLGRGGCDAEKIGEKRAIKVLLAQDRDRASNEAWASVICESLGHDLSKLADEVKTAKRMRDLGGLDEVGEKRLGVARPEHPLGILAALETIEASAPAANGDELTFTKSALAAAGATEDWAPDAVASLSKERDDAKAQLAEARGALKAIDDALREAGCEGAPVTAIKALEADANALVYVRAEIRKLDIDAPPGYEAGAIAGLGRVLVGDPAPGYTIAHRPGLDNPWVLAGPNVEVQLARRINAVVWSWRYHERIDANDGLAARCRSLGLPADPDTITSLHTSLCGFREECVELRAGATMVKQARVSRRHVAATLLHAAARISGLDRCSEIVTCAFIGSEDHPELPEHEADAVRAMADSFVDGLTEQF